jgi:predicted DNA-binding antitoxin AbrB/MazE fold protein
MKETRSHWVTRPIPIDVLTLPSPIPAILEKGGNPSMSKRLDVIYENGVFRPLEPVNVPEHQRMTVTIPEASMVPSEEEWLDTEYERWAATQVKEDVSLEAVRQALSKIPGSLTTDFLAEREDTCDPRA